MYDLSFFKHFVRAKWFNSEHLCKFAEYMSKVHFDRDLFLHCVCVCERGKESVRGRVTERDMCLCICETIRPNYLLPPIERWVGVIHLLKMLRPVRFEHYSEPSGTLCCICGNMTQNSCISF